MPSAPPLTVVATFADRDAAQRAVASLTRDEIAPAKVHLHEKGLRPRNASGVLVDEYASGGFFTNFARLLDGLMNTPHQSPSYEELVQFEGIAVSVETESSEQAERVEAQLRSAGAERVGSGRGFETF